MPEIRQNVATKDWVIIATERAKRPEEFVREKKEPKNIPSLVSTCPFCPGNEDKTPKEIFAIGDKDKWQVRVVGNKFAALFSTIPLQRKIKGIERCISGFGVHEVIIETPRHDMTTALLSYEAVKQIIVAYKTRYNTIAENSNIELITIFKNHGLAAGTSIAHPHSQLVATPVVPSHIRYRVNEAMRYFDDNGECIFCKMIRDELGEKERIIIDSEYFVTFIPYAALSPFHTWIMPKRHMSSFGDISQAEVEDLAKSLKELLLRIYQGLDNPDFNYVIRSIPTSECKTDYFHWYLSLIPRITKTAGFELGSGMFINIALPEESAKFIREISVK
ncbi:MAG: galactose-1-phosphate uridylyltransferase [Candidatus Firestonebacteria bacterium]